MNKDEALRLALEALESNRRTHHYCEDTWYSCPKHEDGCANDSESDECNCGADKANAEIDQAITAIKAALEANDEPEQMAKLGWQVIDCPICGGGARAFPKQEVKDEPEYYGLTKDHLWMSISKEHYDRLKPEFRMACYTTPPQRKPLVFGLNDDGQFTFSVGVQTFTLDYFPENDEETEFMKKQLTHAIEAAHGIKGEA